MYRFETTEQNNQKANDYETKALLYLLSFRKDSRSIETFAIDCFNDVTGCNNKFTILWDVQSKNVQTLNPKKIGIALITLFCNYEHVFPFEHFILIMPKLKEGYLLKEDKEVFQFDNFQSKQREKIKNGLNEEYHRRKNIFPDEKRVNEFLEKINFVIGDKSKIDYVKSITKFKTNIVQDKFFEDIFNEIRDIQTAYKNIPLHNQVINYPSEIKNTKKVFKRTDFDALIINRFIGYDLFKDLSTVPNSFIDSIKDYDTEERKDIIQSANSEIAKLLFDKNSKKAFWLFFENLIIIIKENLNKSSEEIVTLINDSIVKKSIDLSQMTLIYLVSLIKDGWKSEE